MSSSYHKLVPAAVLALALGAAPATTAFAQTQAVPEGEQAQRYTLGGITISGARYLDPNTLIGLTGLKIGDPITIPGEEIGRAIRKLWDQGILGDVSVSITRTEGSQVFLDFNLKERPRLSKFEFTGIGKSQADELKNKIKLIRGKVVTDALLSNTRTQVRKFYTNKGFLDAKVNITQKADSALSNSVVLFINVDKGSKVKINDIVFEGNTAFKDGKLKGKFKKTKEKKFPKLFNSGKYQAKEFADDKEKLIEFYNSQGYRDAVIVSDSLARVGEGLRLTVKVDEGPKYYFRNITWKGNYLYDDKTLASVLGIKEGSVYSKETLDKRLTYNPTGQDVSSLYMNDGYLFFQIDPVETKVEGDSIDIEMRVSEGVQARIKDVNIAGNTKTSDHVVRRALYTLPGDKFSREQLIRSQREIATLGYFDPEKIGLNPVPNQADGTVDINYTVEEKPSDQITLSGGWGGYAGFIGTVGLVFNNFSLRKAGTLRNWTPVPAGDGQRLALNVQANGLQYQAYSFSFTEPWLGGRKPNSLSFSLTKTIYRLGSSFDVNSEQSLKTNGASISLGRRLRWPDDYFTLSNALSVTQYKLKNYPGLGANFFPTGTGNATNVTFNTTLSRNSIDNPTFTRRGSSLSLSVNLTPPYSLFPGSHPSVNEWVEFHKWMFDASWFSPVVGKLVLNTRAHFGFIGSYNSARPIGPFERFKLGGSGLGYGGSSNFIAGTEYVGLRGYADPNDVNSLPASQQTSAGGVVYNKFVMEMRYPVSLNPAATVYVLSFAEAGNSFEQYTNYNPYKLYRSAGVGARIFMSAFGLLGFDYGWGFDKVPVTSAGQKQDKGIFHFIIGQQLR
ncbi:outer membrane protein assembly factor BamA [Hymenobacter metallilatus]|uniref:Outer membrane protein assembly factor BamA n=1 Tax=Hymenobacter metallilatus TaxID=2493666 RepID=A0A3R9NBU4_9BACT|nr:outer membrane protein assembly factor BamA [Hymenobacter metallilatus]RSK30143.1 outer membrane protein assembly factor BamA [Hymenobacter metallilatus]